ncbi:hypothetical protein GCM10010912_65040 [Paenibacillus albidus]|uniref:ATP-grasp domain-containing protein n=1 Tax=Paenibacillus albidus TaxID=2041023 RepID=A0A917D452_9BACL|nr:hypothetical protein [Paenibacillus albidus]GGG11611.1 hypothetical protein GCM10010912_65040 [Paenibacillus albidus]
MKKDDVSFVPFQLPKSLENQCISLVRELGLGFGAIDLIEQGESYVFIEINPTGEWAWLVEASGFNIQNSICDLLIGEK